MISISGVFCVTFSVVFAYVADVTSEEDRSAAYGLVSELTTSRLAINSLVPVGTSPEKCSNDREIFREIQ